MTTNHSQQEFTQRETMNVVIVGHVDHGKSTLVGRLLADTGVLGDGKLEQVQETCKRSGKSFEYAFLLDALEDEQSQGITIDAARVFFRTDLRDYIIIDAPGHVEFLKNMVTGAARAEAAILLIDANEGVRENSRRHGFLLSMLGIKQIVVAVNKIDLVDYSHEVFEKIVEEYSAFLKEIGIEPLQFIPVSAREGDNIAQGSAKMPWYQGKTILELFDGLAKAAPNDKLPLRLPVQDVYKFNEVGDDRRIIAGRIESGVLRQGDELLFLPSGKRSVVESLEIFSASTPTELGPGENASIRMREEIFVGRGEIACHVDAKPQVSTMLRVNLFWLGRQPMSKDRRYKLKLGTSAVEVVIDSIEKVLDASSLNAETTKTEIERHSAAEVILKTRRPIAFDSSADLEATGRFVIVDGYDIAGGGIVREAISNTSAHSDLDQKSRDTEWVRGKITSEVRAELFGHPPLLITISGDNQESALALARELDEALLKTKHHSYFLDEKNLNLGLNSDLALDDYPEFVRRFGELCNLMLDAGMVLVATTQYIGKSEREQLQSQLGKVAIFSAYVGAEASRLHGADLFLTQELSTEAASEKLFNAVNARLKR